MFRDPVTKMTVPAENVLRAEEHADQRDGANPAYREERDRLARKPDPKAERFREPEETEEEP